MTTPRRRGDGSLERVSSLGPAIRIVTSLDGGPVRRIVNGRSDKFTGYYVAVKAGFNPMPWESRYAERDGMILMEASSRVMSLLAQPHRLEMDVVEQARALMYFPDNEIQTTPCMLDDLQAGMPFSRACLAPNRSRETPDRLVRLILEFKDEKDKRRNDPHYKAKLSLAEQVYASLGIPFMIIERKDGFDPKDVRYARLITVRKMTQIGPEDIRDAKTLCELGGGAVTAGEMVALLGGGAVGWSKLRALHVRRVLEIDLADKLVPDSRVWPVPQQATKGKS